MNKTTITIIFVLLIGGGIAAFVMYIKARTPKYKWETEYDKNSKQPYGFNCFYDLLKEQKNKVTTINSSSYYELDSTITNSNLVIVDSYLYADSLSLSYLINYMQNGNTVFLAVDETPIYLLETVFSLPTGSLYEFNVHNSDQINVRFAPAKLPYSEILNFKHQYLKKIQKTDWNGYRKHNFDKDLRPHSAIAISYFSDSIVNCFYVNVGKGKLIVHSNPKLFANYNLIQKSGFKNLNNILAFFNDGVIYWSDYEYENSNNTGGYENNPLKFLFSHYTLKIGWYVFLASVFIFILFRSKREQRIIPIIYKNKNTSIEFAKAIGSLYYRTKAHHNVANEMYLIFLAEIRTRYNISTILKEPELIEQMVIKTEVKKEILIDLFKLFRETRHNVNTKPKELVQLYKALENFNNIKK